MYNFNSKYIFLIFLLKICHAIEFDHVSHFPLPHISFAPPRLTSYMFFFLSFIQKIKISISNP